MIILWTDALVFLLIIIVLASAFYLKNNSNIRRPLSKLSSNKVAMVSLLILFLFASIGLLDSLHYKASSGQSNDIISVLDTCLNTLRMNTEKSYSAPLSDHAFSKEHITLADGSQAWDYPRLQYGGAHLSYPEQNKTQDILIKFFTGFGKGLGFCLGFILLLFLWQQYTGKKIFKQAVVTCLLGVMATIICSSYGVAELATYYHVLGTDKVGEDVLYQTLKSIRTGLVIGTLTTLIMLPLAITFGILAGYFRGWVDDLIQYLYTTLSSIPSVLLIAASILMVQVYMANHEEAFTSLAVRADMRLLFLCLILGMTSWTALCRLLRAETLKLREMEFVQAARSLGVHRISILHQHILPNLMHIVLISIVLDFSSLVLAEAVLSYINIGVDPTTYSWGNMINSARLEMAREPVVWWSLTAAFIFMFTLVLVANLFADAVRDAFDPRRANHD